MATDIKRLTEQLIGTHEQACRRMPSERNNSIGEVARRLREKHVSLIVWAQDKHGVFITSHNLHNVIENYSNMQVAASVLPKGADWMIDATGVSREPGTILPEHFLEYFREMKK